MSETKTTTPPVAPAGKTKTAQAGTITVFGLALLNITAVISLNGLPSEAEYGLSSVFYYLLAAVVFLVPVSLVAAELATGWPEKGGVFRWIGEAFRGRIGFMAMFLAWVEVCVFIPTSLTFGAVSIAYINPDEKAASALSSNPVFVLVIVLVVFWIALFVALLGSKGFAAMAKWGGIIGVFIPIAVLVVLGVAYAAAGNAPQMDVSWGELIPDFSSFGTVVLAASIFLMYAGMEMNAVHVKEVKDATRNFPIAIFISAIVTVLIFVLGTLAIAWIVPQKDINLTQAILVTYFDIFTWAGIPWAGSVVAIMLAIGVLVNITTWVAGPSTGLLAVAKAGYLPKAFQKTNKHGAAVTIMFTQAGIVTLVSVLFVLLPSVQSAYQILNQLANILYLTVYLLMFASIIRLRYTQPDRPRPFRLRQGQRHRVDRRRRRVPRGAHGLRLQLHPARADQRRKPGAVHRHPGRPGAALLRRAEHHLSAQEAVVAVERPRLRTLHVAGPDPEDPGCPDCPRTRGGEEVSAAAYDRVRFIGYAIPTTPADMVDVGDPNGSGAVAGTYRASDDFETDIHARAAVLKAAVDTAKAVLADLGDPGILNVFVAPEFFWHGTMGPYVHKPAEADPADTILALLQSQFTAEEYPHFLFVLGSVISAEVGDIDQVFASSTTKVRNDIVKALGEGWTRTAGPLSDVIFDMFVNFVKNGHAYPVVEVRNRALILSSSPVDGVLGNLGATALTTEKYFDSNEDFLLWDVTGKPVVTEQMTAYPVLDTTGGDFKSAPLDPYAIFTVPTTAEPVTVGVEICLDHSDHRLRKSVARSPWPARGDGVDLHLIPSCGMQLHVPSVAARAGGWAFNCDGQYILGSVATAGSPQKGTPSGVASTYTDYADAASPAYGAHTQLARVHAAAHGGDQMVAGAHDATFDPASDVDVTVIPVTPAADLDEFFAGGPGAVHIYGKDEPLPLHG